MAPNRGFSSSHLTSTLSGVALALVTAAVATLASAAPPATQGNSSFLALGDSVVFGYIADDGFAYGNANNFIGYPDYAGRDLRFDTANAACPGETTGSFISPSAADNGCRPYKTNFPLHAGYTSTQLDYATNFLATHKQARLVIISLGADDGFLLEAACGGNIACIQNGLLALLGTIYSNMNTILGDLRATGFRGVLMVVNYYSVDYTDQVQTGFTIAINQTLAAVAAANGAVVADAFSAFQTAASTPFAGGKTCMAGLLNASAANQFLCDVHPSQSGQQLLADTVELTYQAALAAH
jgi:lysophospholipase L1-like esterase